MQVACVFTFAWALAACSGGESGGGAAPVASPITGTFVDSPVNGLHYTSVPSNPAGGLTANGGQYQCVPGDTVTFDLGGRVIGAGQPCGEVVTVLSVFGATSITDLRVRNLAQLLLTLSGIPAGTQPIELPATIPATLPVHLDFADPQFEQRLQAALPGRTLVGQAQVAAHLSASFTTLTVTAVNGGKITSIPAGLVCTTGTCSQDFVAGTRVTLAAVGTGFTGWSGTAGCAGTGTCQVLLTAMQAVRAVFSAVPPPATLTINPNLGTGTGQVQCSTGGAFGSCAATYSTGTQLTLRGVANGGSTFTGWSNGTGNISCTGIADCSVTVAADSSVTATFTLAVTNFSVTATVATSNGGGGTVQCSVNGGAAGPCGSYAVGSSIVMTATPNAASNFTGWTGAGCTGTGTCTFTLTANTAVTANFNRPVLTVTVVGTGIVSSNPTGITNCASSCTASFNRGTTITLMATGTGFTGWSGGCSGTGSCALTNIQSNTSVTATFGAVSSSANYRFVWADGGALMAIDPAAPTATPATVVSLGVHGTQFVADATYNSGPQTFTNLRESALTFVQGGKHWRVNVAKSAGIPGSAANPAVQVSNETGATNLCTYQVIQTASPSTARIFYELGGADADCLTRADNVSKLTPVLADASTPSFTLPAGTRPTGNGTTLVNFTTGQSVAIFLTDYLNADTLKRLDLVTNTVTTIQANVGDVEFAAQDTSDRVFLRNNNRLFVYTLSTNTLTTLLTTTTSLQGPNTINGGDSTNLFVFEVSGRVYRVPMGARTSTDVVTLISTPTVEVSQLEITDTRLILRTTASTLGGTQSGLVSLPKTGGAPITLVPLQDDFVIISATAGNLVYYYSFSFTSFAGFTAVVVQDDGIPVTTFPESKWDYRVQGDTYSPRIQGIGVSRIIRTAFGPSSANPITGGTMMVHNATTPLVATLSLGTVPEVIPTIQVFNFSVRLGSSSLIGDLSPGVVPGSHPVYFADITQAGSLVPVPVPLAEWQIESF